MGPANHTQHFTRIDWAAHKRRHLVAQLAQHFIWINDDPRDGRDWLGEASKEDNETWNNRMLRKPCPC